jgi:hypothetical protein
MGGEMENWRDACIQIDLDYLLLTLNHTQKQLIESNIRLEDCLNRVELMKEWIKKSEPAETGSEN